MPTRVLLESTWSAQALTQLWPHDCGKLKAREKSSRNVLCTKQGHQHREVQKEELR